MSRGIGRVQRKVIDELQRAPGALLQRGELIRRLPHEAERRALHRSIRGLLNRGLVHELHFGGRRYLALSFLGNEELLGSNDPLWLLETICRARGIPVPDLADPSWRERLDAYRPGRKISD